ncbi:MAG: hypothetical protein HY343_01390 [Lentisphaerae bacterium]|nr:hypothetical protein [Lentisphaerota bacterium]
MNPELIAHSLEAIGFTFNDGGFHSGALSATLEPDWLRLETQAPGQGGDGEPFADMKPGLWKPLGPAGSSNAHLDAVRRLSQPAAFATELWRAKGMADLLPVRQAFLPVIRNVGGHNANCWAGSVADIPLAVFETEQDGLQAALSDVIAWLRAASDGSIPTMWRPPAAETLAEWLPPDARCLRCGSILKTLECETNGGTTLALRCVLTETRMDFSDNRRDWLRATLLEWQTRCRMVRLARSEQRLVAEADLTGAPPDVIENLLRAGLDCLKAALPLIIPVLDVLPDVALADIPFPRHRAMAGSSETTTKKGGCRCKR